MCRAFLRQPGGVALLAEPIRECARSKRLAPGIHDERQMLARRRIEDLAQIGMHRNGELETKRRRRGVSKEGPTAINAWAAFLLAPSLPSRGHGLSREPRTVLHLRPRGPELKLLPVSSLITWVET